MSRARRARWIVSVVNMGLVVATGWLGYSVVRRPPPESPAAGFLPTRFATDDGSLKVPRDLSVVGAQLDRPLPPPDEDDETKEPEPAPPPRSTWKLVLAMVDPDVPERSAGILEDRAGLQRTVGVGSWVDPRRKQVKLSDLKIEGLGDERVAVATLEEGGRTLVLRLHRPAPPKLP